MWDYDFAGSSNVVSTYVTYLRRKLASDGPNLEVAITVTEPTLTSLLSDGFADRPRRPLPNGSHGRPEVVGALTVTGDQELLSRAVDNLMMNVLVHTPAAAAGTITATGGDDDATIEVSDGGPGVPPDQLPHIFERFYRAAERSDGHAVPELAATA